VILPRSCSHVAFVSLSRQRQAECGASYSPSSAVEIQNSLFVLTACTPSSSSFEHRRSNNDDDCDDKYKIIINLGGFPQRKLPNMALRSTSVFGNLFFALSAQFPSRAVTRSWHGAHSEHPFFASINLEVQNIRVRLGAFVLTALARLTL
jgi:hypothetical protein